MHRLAYLAVAGALGTVARYWLTDVIHRCTKTAFPAGTLVVNVVGCFLIGLIAYVVREHQALGPEARIVIIAGLLGGFTTFSAFGYETVELLRAGSLVLAGLNVGANVLVGLVAVWLGTAAARLTVAILP